MTLANKSEDVLQHPIYTRQYAVDTPPIQKFFATVCEWIDNRVPGGYIHGPSRFGKSRAVKYWIKELIDDHYYGRISFFRTICPSLDHPSEREFLRNLIGSLHIRFTSNKSIVQTTWRVANFLCASARARKSNYVVFMIDEGQRLTSVEYGVLCNIQNLMEDAGFQLTVIAVGSHELAYQHESFLLGMDMHIVGRFMVNSAAFHGIQSVRELSYTLAGYDEAEWPEGSGISFTSYFFPKASARGLRVEGWAEDLWEIYQELAPPSLRPRLQIPMEHVGRTVEQILRSLAQRDSSDFEVSINDLRAAVVYTKYPAHMRVIAAMTGGRHSRMGHNE